MKSKDITNEQICQSYRDYSQDQSKCADALLMERTMTTCAVVNVALSRAVRDGLITFDNTVRTGRLTEKGEALLPPVTKPELTEIAEDDESDS